jgi:hypothetical protein
MVSLKARCTIVFLTAMLCSGSTLNAWAAVSAHLSAQTIDELETVRLSIKITETRQSQTLDLSALEEDFSVLNTNTISQSRFLNGRGHSWVDYQITLQPKRTGIIAIPSIEVGGERTPTLQLRVRPLSDQTRQLIDELVFFEATVSASSIYVQSQLVLTRRLFYSQGVQLYSDLPGAPEISDAVILTLGETRSSSAERNGRPYGVVEQQYAIFPERSGSFTIPSISITASVRLLEGNRTSRKGVRIATDAIDIEVLPVPAEYPQDQPWIPAEKVRLFDVINPDLSTYNVGDTVTHEMLIHLEGNVGTMAPPLDLAISEDDFRIYPQAPQIQDDTSGNSVKGSRLQTHSLVPLVPGRLQVPAAELVWWDTVNRRVRVSSTKPRTIQVAGQAVQPAAPAEIQPSEMDTAESSQSVEGAVSTFDWMKALPYIVAVPALLLATFLVWIARRWFASMAQRRKRSTTQARVEPRTVRKALRRAAMAQDDMQLHHHLLTYLSEHYRLPGHEAIMKFRQSSPATAAAVDELLGTLYGGRHGFSAAHRETLVSHALQLEPHTPSPHTGRLPPLYPQMPQPL